MRIYRPPLTKRTPSYLAPLSTCCRRPHPSLRSVTSSVLSYRSSSLPPTCHLTDRTKMTLINPVWTANSMTLSFSQPRAISWLRSLHSHSSTSCKRSTAGTSSSLRSWSRSPLVLVPSTPSLLVPSHSFVARQRLSKLCHVSSRRK